MNNTLKRLDRPVKTGTYHMIFLIVTASALFIILLMYACGFPGCNMIAGDSPAECLKKFAAHLDSGDYAEAEKYIYNYDTLGFENTERTGWSKKLYDCINDSLSITVLDESENTGYSAVVTAQIDVLDYRKLEQPLSDMVSAELQRREMNGEHISSPDMTDQLLESIIDSFLAESQQYHSSAQFDITMMYEDDRWKIVFTHDLYSALIGYTL